MNSHLMRWTLVTATVFTMAALPTAPVEAQTPFPSAEKLKISAKDRKHITRKLKQLQKAVAELKQDPSLKREQIADVEVYAKAAEWTLRHGEFYRPAFVGYTLQALNTGLKRAEELKQGRPGWLRQAGTTIRGYYSKVDGSVQPYALTLPTNIKPKSVKRYPLHVKLHGRGRTLNEVSFIHRHDGKPLPDGQTWVQLDVFGRTNNAYRWSGETDVFEAMDNLRRTARIDEQRIVLTGFSMGGAGAWHLGLHYPSKWCSVGPGAGFVDFYEYQNQTEKRPAYQHRTLGIYDSIDYARNAHNVPICTYGGEKDKQLAASTRMVAAAKKHGIDIKLIIGKGAGHKFTPEGYREFMAFHRARMKEGRPRFPGRTSVRFVTRTLKYNRCEWATIEEIFEMYKPAVVEGDVDKKTGRLNISTRNVVVLSIARDIADEVNIDGTVMPLARAARGLLPDVYYAKTGDGWRTIGYEESRKFPGNPHGHKRHNLQGPIDDAFMQPFVCVRGTGTPWSIAQHNWAEWTLNRFEREFDKWLRGRVPVVKDSNVTDELIESKNLILFGDPGSNSVLARVVEKLPIDVKWTKDGIAVQGTRYDADTHGLSLIFPNPLNPRRYIVINSGHTFHEKDFRASNSWLFPRLGDIAVQKFQRQSDDSYEETIMWAALFNGGWRLPRKD